MSVLVVTKQTRPNTSIPFLDLADISTQEFKTYFQETYVVTGKYMGLADVSISDDGLVSTQTALWRSLADHDQFLNDPVIFENIVVAYRNYNIPRGITREIVSRTEVS
jgi:hypothetical protein